MKQIKIEKLKNTKKTVRLSYLELNKQCIRSNHYV